jgi:hypothetical protein
MPHDPFAQYVVTGADPFAAYVVKAEAKAPAEDTYVSPFGYEPSMDLPEQERARAAFQPYEDVAKAYAHQGPQRVIGGLKRIGHGEIAGGAHDIISGGAVTAAPFSVPALVKALVTAPVATVGTIATGYLGGKGAQAGAEALGASPDQAALAGDVGSIVAPSLATAAANRVLPPLKQGLDTVSTRMMRGAIKANTGDLNKMAGAQRVGIDEMSERVAKSALERDINPLTKRGAAQIQGRIDETSAARDAAIANAPPTPVPGSGFRQLSSVRPVAQQYRQQSTPQSDIATIQRIGREMLDNPALTKPGGGMRDLTPQELADLNTGDNRALRDRFGKSSAEIDAKKAIVGQRVQDLERAVPGTREQGQEMKTLIDLRKVSRAARKRAENRDSIGLTDIIALANPKTLVASTLMRPAVQAGAAGGIYRAGQALPAKLSPAEVTRLVALLTQLQGP